MADQPLGAAGREARAGGEALAWDLRALCKDRFLEGTVRQVLAEGRQDLATNQSSLRNPQQQPYIVLVVDALTELTVRASCETQELLREGICLVERIDAPDRQPLPLIDACYFISPSVVNARALVRDAGDASGGTSSAEPMYRTFYVYVSSKMSQGVLDELAKAPRAVERLGAFAELNLSFSPYDSRCFHFGDYRALQALLTQDEPREEDIERASCALATVMLTLGDTCRIVCSRRTTKPVWTARLADAVKARLAELEAAGVRHAGAAAGAAGALSSTLVVADRAADWNAALVCDFTYEPLVYDALGPDAVAQDIHDHAYRYVDGDERKHFNLDPSNARYAAQRHLPFWKVSDNITIGLNEWSIKESRIKNMRAECGESAGAVMATTIEMLTLSREHKTEKTRLEEQSSIAEFTMSEIERRSLFTLARLMQDLTSNVDKALQPLRNWTIDSEMKSLLEEPSLSAETKLRLYLIYSMSDLARQGAPGSFFFNGSDSAANLKAWQDHLEPQDKLVREHPTWRATQRAAKQEPAEERQAREQRALGRNSSKLSPRSRQFCRFEPWLYEVVENAARNDLGGEFRPVLEAKAAPDRPKAVVVFIVGGITLSEIRVAHQASKALGVEVFLGGSCVLTPDLVVNELRAAAST